MSFVPTTSFDSIGSSGDDALRWYCPPEQWRNTNNSGDEDDNNNNNDNNTSDEDDVSTGWWKVVPRTLDGHEDGNNNNNKKKAANKACLQLAPPSKRDFWRKTYYQPLLVKDDGPFLYRTIDISQDLPIMIETSFTIDDKSQFDQAGVMVRIDHDHWVKTGIEVVDGIARLSCVVTNDFSDWSTQVWPTPAVAIRVHVLPQHGGSIVVEAAESKQEPSSSSSSSTPSSSSETASSSSSSWSFIRIAHLNRNMRHDVLNEEEPAVTNAYQGLDPPDGCMMVGLFGACPVKQDGMVVTFDYLSIQQGSTFVHDA